MATVALPPRAGCALWLIALDSPSRPGAADLLSADERERAARFVFDRDRHRFIAARAAMRELLGAHLGEPAAALRFAYGPQGKPDLVDAPECRFNLSHSGGWGILALNLGEGEIGVDIERLRDMPDALSLAAFSLNPRDVQTLEAVEPPQRSHAFLTAWTRGEACLKALGTGFSGSGIPIVGIESAPARIRLAATGADDGVALIETFELNEAQAIASLVVMTPDKGRLAKLAMAQAA